MPWIPEWKATFLRPHLRRCREIPAGQQSVASLVKSLRKNLSALDPETQALTALKWVGGGEVKLFRAMAAVAVDRVFPLTKEGVKASARPENKDLLDFVALLTPSVRLKARAGSGKSTAIRIKCDFLINTLGVAPEAIQILTFNEAAALKLKADITEHLGEEVGCAIRINTFHSLAYGILQKAPETADIRLYFRGDLPPAADMSRAVNEILSPAEIEGFRKLYAASSFHYLQKMPDFEKQLRDFIEKAAQRYRARRQPGVAISGGAVMEFLHRVAEAYEAQLQKENALDGEGGLRRAAEVLSAGGDLSRMRRLDGGLQFLFVDEYQDFSAAFELLTQGLISRNANCVVNVVGDDWQAINAFMGADLSFFEGFRENYPRALNRPLRTNWRCGAQIVDLGNAVMSATEGAVAGLDHKGQVRIRVGYIETQHRSKKDWEPEVRSFVMEEIQKLAEQAWQSDLQAGRAPGSLALLAAQNSPYGQTLAAYLEALSPMEGAKVEVSTVHRAKGSEWDHVILLDGVDSQYPSSHPGDLLLQGMMNEAERIAEGERLLYVAVTRAIHSLAIVAPTKLHPKLTMAADQQ